MLLYASDRDETLGQDPRGRPWWRVVTWWWWHGGGAGCASGVAAITVAASGQNSIVLAPGANLRLTEEDIERAHTALLDCAVLLCQNEIPPATTLAAMRMTHGKGPLVRPHPPTSSCLTLRFWSYSSSPRSGTCDVRGTWGGGLQDEAGTQAGPQLTLHVGGFRRGPS